MNATKVLYLKILWNDNNVVSSAYDESITMTTPSITYIESQFLNKVMRFSTYNPDYFN